MLKEEKKNNEINDTHLEELKKFVFDCDGSLGVMLDKLYKLSDKSPKDCRLILNYISECLGREISVSEILNLPEDDLKKIGVKLVPSVKILNSSSSDIQELSLLDIANAIGEDYKHGRK